MGETIEKETNQPPNQPTNRLNGESNENDHLLIFLLVLAGRILLQDNKYVNSSYFLLADR